MVITNAQCVKTTMAETTQQKQERLDRLKARQQALLDRARSVQRKIARAESVDKAKRKKQDDRTKLIVGVAILNAAQRDARILSVLREAIRGLTSKDQGFLAQESTLWAEVIKTQIAPHNHLPAVVTAGSARGTLLPDSLVSTSHRGMFVERSDL